MNKKTILLKNTSPAIPCVEFWQPYFEQFFNIERMSIDKNFYDYDPKKYVFWASSLENAVEWVEQVLDAGFSLIMDYLWDHFGYNHSADNILILRSNNFIFANEVLNYNFQDYQSLNFESNPNKFLLCLMHQQRAHRDQIYTQVQKYSATSYISYLSKGISIPGDVINLTENDAVNGSPVWQRYVNTLWYNKTNLSLVVETGVRDSRFYSEKILKPLAFKHPFITWAPFNILDRIKLLGFETYGNIIDESYNLEQDDTKRLAMICKELERLYKEFNKDNRLFTDALTLEKIQHNYNLFYNKNLIDSIIEKEIIEPVREFVYGQ